MPTIDDPRPTQPGTITNRDDLARLIEWGRWERSSPVRRWDGADTGLLGRLTDAHRFLLDISRAEAPCPEEFPG